MESTPAQSGDNLPARQKMIMQRLITIRANKQRILDTLREMKEKLSDDEGMNNREMMAKMIASYDVLSAQEDEYMQVMQHIVSIRANATEDVEEEIKQVQQQQQQNMVEPTNGNGAGGDDKTINNDGNTNELTMHNNDNEHNGDADTTDQQQQQQEKNEDDDWKEVEEELTKLGRVAGEAVAASMMNEKLVEKLQLHRNKKAALEQLRLKQSESQRGAANEALHEVEMARLKVAAEQEQIERKRKTLERLRREALRRGIKLDAGPASEPDLALLQQQQQQQQQQHIPKSATEAKLRAKLDAKKKQNEQQEVVDDNSPPIPDNLVPSQRIPPIVGTEHIGDHNEHPTDTTTAGTNGTSKKKKKGKRAKEQAKERRDAINASIREKLAAIEARKERMRVIQSQLLKPIIMENQMNETFQVAQQRLKKLIAMREHLEELQGSGEAIPEETVAMLEKELVDEENAQQQQHSAAIDIVGSGDNGANAGGDSVDVERDVQPTLEHLQM